MTDDFRAITRATKKSIVESGIVVINRIGIVKLGAFQVFGTYFEGKFIAPFAGVAEAGAQYVLIANPHGNGCSLRSTWVFGDGVQQTVVGVGAVKRLRRPKYDFYPLYIFFYRSAQCAERQASSNEGRQTVVVQL